MLAPYRELLARPGTLAFSGWALVARMPISMLGIGLVLLVTEVRGSYGDAGAVAAVSLVAGSLAAPLQARLADRAGQARVLPPLLLAHAASLSVAVAAATDGGTLWALALAAAAAGATLPQFGAFVRARWAALLGPSPALGTAYALESVLDEVVFVLGPVLITLVATTFGPDVGVLGTLLLTCGGGLGYTMCRSTVPPVHGLTGSQSRQRLPVRALTPLVIAFTGLGMVFGTAEVTTVAFTDQAGTPWAAGVVLASFAAGSLLAGVVAGTRPPPTPQSRRFPYGLLLLSFALLPATTVASWPALAGVLALAGLAIAPTLIAGFTAVQQRSPAERLTEALAWSSTALGIGVALGAAVSGQIIDRVDPSAAFLVAVVSGLLGGLVTLLAWRTGSVAATPVGSPSSGAALRGDLEGPL